MVKDFVVQGRSGGKWEGEGRGEKGEGDPIKQANENLLNGSGVKVRKNTMLCAQVVFYYLCHFEAKDTRISQILNAYT